MKNTVHPHYTPWDVVKRLFKVLQKNMPGYHLRIQMLRWSGYKIGEQVYIGEDCLIIDEINDRGMVTIGNRVAIAPRVTLVTSSYPNESLIRPYAPVEFGPIIIEDDVWIGTGVTIFPGVCIHRGAVVGAASLVTHDVPPFTIVAGVPARVIRKLDVPEVLGVQGVKP
jgi:maltose O-acetyltransferase